MSKITKAVIISIATPLAIATSGIGLYNSDITVEDVENYTPAIVSENFNEDIEYTGLEVTDKDKVPEVTEMGSGLFEDLPD